MTQRESVAQRDLAPLADAVDLCRERSDHVPRTLYMGYKRASLMIGLTFVAVWLLLCLVVGIVAGEWSLHPGRRVLRPAGESLARAIAAQNHAELADVAVTAEDGAMLRGWSMRPVNWNGDAVILLHGVADNRMGMLGYAELLLRHGYAVLLPNPSTQRGASFF
jgi:hypothetical protein